jgi:hypothetical protein
MLSSCDMSGTGRLRLLALALPFLFLTACSRAPRVRFENDTCFINDVPAGIQQVEEEEALISQHMAERQPLFILTTLMVVLLATAGYVLRIIDVVAVRNKDGLGFTDRLRQSLERHRAHPARYFSMIAGAFVLLLVASGFYLSLDSDKRASERGLGLLQFCHLALRTADEHNVLSQQRLNLEALAATAGHIQLLVDKLPPDEQKKAKLVIDQVSKALDKQDRELSDSLDRNAEAAAEVRAQTMLVERGLSSVAANVLMLKSVPSALSDLGKSEQEFGARLDAVDAKLGTVDEKLGTVSDKLDGSARADSLDDVRAGVAALAKRLDAIEARMRQPPARAPRIPAKPQASVKPQVLVKPQASAQVPAKPPTAHL